MKKITLISLAFLVLTALPSHSKAPSASERLAKGEVLIETNKEGFVCKFMVEGDPQKLWDELRHADRWKSLFSLVLSSHELDDPKKEDYKKGARYKNYRIAYVKGRYRGRIQRMLFKAQISGTEATSKKSLLKKLKKGKTKSTSSKLLKRLLKGKKSSLFRGGSISLEGPINNISGSPFIDLKNFVKIGLSLRAKRKRVGRSYTTSTLVTLQVKIEYNKLFLADKEISLFRLDYRSSEFDRQIKLGLKSIASDFRQALQ